MFCPRGCKTDYSGDQYLHLENDANDLPAFYTCPKCGHKVALTVKQKMIEIIYRAQRHFSVPEYCEVDEYYIEDEDAVMERLLQVIPSVRHIAKHLEGSGRTVMCKICEKTYDEITGQSPE